MRACPGGLPASAGCDHRYAVLAELRLPCAADWLSAAEQEASRRFRDAGRLRAWLAGRLLAKRLVAARLATIEPGLVRSAAEIEIQSGRRAPVAIVAGRTLPWSLSIAHSGRAVLVGLSCVAGMSIGVDLAEAAPAGRGFAELWFSRRECDSLAPGLLWASKEAVYKAAGRDEPFDPRRIEIQPGAEAACTARFRPGDETFSCFTWPTPHGEIAALAVKRDG